MKGIIKMKGEEVEKRKSDRISLNKAVKASKEEESKKQNNNVVKSNNPPRKKVHKTKTLSQLGYPSNPKVKKEPVDETPLPETDILEFAIEVLQRQDPHDYFANPVDPKKVKYYYDCIPEPMDFRTIKDKIREGKYRKLEQFEYDVNLIPENAMRFNGRDTVYFKKACVIKALAEKVVDQLKSDPKGLKSKFSLTRSQKGCKRACTSGSTSGTKCQKQRSSSNNSDNGRHDTYVPWCASNSIVSTVCDASKRLVPRNGVSGYKESLTQFVRGLGPTAAKVAARKLAQCFPEPKLPSRHLMHQPSPAQIPIRSLTVQLPPLPTRSLTGQQPQGQSRSLVGLDSCIPRRPTGIVIGLEAPPPVTRGPIINPKDKGKGILVDDVSNISKGTLKSALADYADNLFCDRKGKGVVVDGSTGHNSSDFFKQMLNFKNGGMDVIDADPPGVMSAQPVDTVSQPSEQEDLLLQVFKNQLGSATNARSDWFNIPTACPSYNGPYSNHLEFVSRWVNNRPRPLVHASSVVIPSSLCQNNVYTNPGYGASSARPTWNPSTQWSPQPVNVQSKVVSEVEPKLSFSNPVVQGAGQQLGRRDGAWYEQRFAGPEYRFVENPPVVYFQRNRNEGGDGQDQAGRGGSDQQHLVQCSPDLALHLGSRPPPYI